MKIKFLSFNYTSPFSFNPIYYWLKSFYKKNGVHFDKYEWLPSEHVHKDSTLDDVINQGTDILCISVYLWNIKSSMKIAQQAKEINPNLIIICGGPECDAHSDPEWFSTYPFVDYAVYGDGEQAFAGLLDYLYDKEIDFKAIPNVVNKDTKNNHVIMKFKNFPAYSPYLDLKEEFLEDYFGLKESIGGKAVYLPYEIVRGCMYKCSFCDWHGGIHHKVNKRINDYKEDVDFFAEYGIRAFQTDANVGIYEDDVEFYEYVAKKAKDLGPDRMITVEPRNMAKLHKSRVYRIWDILSSIDSKPKFAIKSAVQSMYEDTLLKIDRPDVPWPDHKKMVRNICEKHPDKQLTMETIMGLPGMTYDRIHNTFLEFADIPVHQTYSYDWMLLKKAPAANPEYRKKHNLSCTKTFYPALIAWLDGASNIKLSDFEKSPEIPIEKNQAYYIDLIYDTDSGVKGVLYHKILNEVYNTLARREDFNKDFLESYLNKHNDYYLDIAESESQKQAEYLKQYGFFFWGAFDEETQLVKPYEFMIRSLIKEA